MRALHATWRGQFVLSIVVVLVAGLWFMGAIHGAFRQAVEAPGRLALQAGANLDAAGHMAQALQRIDSAAEGRLRARADAHPWDSAVLDFRHALLQAQVLDDQTRQRSMLDELDTHYVDMANHLAVLDDAVAHGRASEAQSAFQGAHHAVVEEALPGLSHLLSADGDVAHPWFAAPDGGSYTTAWAALALLMLAVGARMAWVTHRVLNLGVSVGLLLVVMTGWAGSASLSGAARSLVQARQAYDGWLAVEQNRCQAVSASLAPQQAAAAFKAANDGLSTQADTDRAELAFQVHNAIDSLDSFPRWAYLLLAAALVWFTAGVWVRLADF